MTGLPTFQDVRRDAYRRLGDIEDLLRSDWTDGTGPTRAQAQSCDEARRLIARAKLMLVEPEEACDA